MSVLGVCPPGGIGPRSRTAGLQGEGAIAEDETT